MPAQHPYPHANRGKSHNDKVYLLRGQFLDFNSDTCYIDDKTALWLYPVEV